MGEIDLKSALHFGQGICILLKVGEVDSDIRILLNKITPIVRQIEAGPIKNHQLICLRFC